MIVHSFSAISDKHSKILILGSIPGKESLKRKKYYAHPRNTFWVIMERLFSIPSELSYQSRCELLLQHNVAIWDVLKTCTRASSLDSDILESSIVTNNFEEFFYRHDQIKSIFFNGAKAEQIYKRYVLNNLDKKYWLKSQRLPSTSPAHAAMNAEAKYDKWKVILNPLNSNDDIK